MGVNPPSSIASSSLSTGAGAKSERRPWMTWCSMTDWKWAKALRSEEEMGGGRGKGDSTADHSQDCGSGERVSRPMRVPAC